MPNVVNIDHPATLIGYGRSGTSLVHKCFEAHPEFDVVGESAELIFSVWHACELTRNIVRGEWINSSEAQRTPEQQWKDAVQSVFLTMFKSERKYWLQKPISLPSCFDFRSDWGTNMPKFCSWYWDVLSFTF